MQSSTYDTSPYYACRLRLQEPPTARLAIMLEPETPSQLPTSLPRGYRALERRERPLACVVTTEAALRESL